MGDRSFFSARRAAAVAAVALLMGLTAGMPARALDDGEGSIFDVVKNVIGSGIGFGLGGDDEKPRIDYRERAPLVLPPNMQNLPTPAAPVAQRNAAWPKDYDSERVRRSQDQIIRSREDQFGGMNARDIRTVGRLQSNPQRDPTRENCYTGDLGELCNPTQFWNVMKNTRSPAGDNRDLVAGQEPKRARLTDPPTGMRTPKKTAKYTFEVTEEVPIADPRAQYREEIRRGNQVD